MKLREQIAQQPPIRRASLPQREPYTGEHTASYHHVGRQSGMHPEDQPYMPVTRSRNHAPTTTNAYIAVEEEEFHSRPTTRVGTSTRRYDLAPYSRGERRTEELPHQGKHPLFYIGICLVILVVFLTAYTLIPPALQKWSDDRTYGYPRSFQTDANVGHGLGASHFLVVNVHGTIEVVELPNAPNTAVQPHLYIIMHLSGQGADLVPATVSFPDVNGDGKPDMQVTVYDGTNPSIWILFNNGTTFVPKL
jgi:hypothetical protein